GLMITVEGPKVLEYNCRMGDPETQAILLRAEFDLAEALLATAKENISAIDATWKRGASICVVVASKGYPEKPVVGAQIQGVDSGSTEDDRVVFHAGTRREGHNYYVSGGRVLGATGFGRDLGVARTKAYDVISSVIFDGMQYRTDIGGADVEQVSSASGSNRL
ncbi:MAG: phosphoribosylglycinamide synthetase C domain-containing protein, partial [Candidatus Acidiferrales bacterium]